MQVHDIRQSKKWSEYLSMYNWNSIELDNGIILRSIPVYIFKLAKCQRPRPFTDKDLTIIEDVCKKNKILYLTIFPHQQQNEDVFLQMGYKPTKNLDVPVKTMFIDLTLSEDVLWKNLSSKCRYSIKRSEKDKVHIEFIRNPDAEQIKKFYNVVNNRGKSKKFYVQSLKDYYKKGEVFGDEAYIVNAYTQDGLLGSKMFLGHNKCVWYMYAGTTPIGQKYQSGYKMMWESILYFKKLGYETMDLEGLADDRVPAFYNRMLGFSAFKQKFGGEIIEFPLPYSKRLKIYNNLF